jgi:molybdopterin-containing oxidoreductase family iron-sulfur binding subunit
VVVKGSGDACGEAERRRPSPLSRRGFLRTLGAAAGSVGLAASGCTSADLEEYFQRHYLRLTPEERDAVLERIEMRTRERYGVDVDVTDPPPIPGVELAYALNVAYCIGCRRCVYACQRENNQSRNPMIHYIRVLRMEEGSLEVEHADPYFEGVVPEEGSFYFPLQCHQCANAPCTRACPVRATWREPDGIVVIDYDWCIGCRYCQAACPYFARRFNFSEPVIRPSEINPVQAYLGNRLRRQGVVEKCTFCIQRVRNGRYPACVEVCPTGSRKFGNLNDPESEVRRIIDSRRVYVFKEDLGTVPRFFYFFD